MNNISITEPLSRAWSRMVLVLFQPFELSKWLKLGFAAWLATLGQGGGACNGSSGGGGNSGSSRSGSNPWDEIRSGIDPVWAWVHDHLVLVIALAVALLLLIAVVSLVVGWVKARGEFMFMDGIARNRGAVVEPWRAYRNHGNSLFLTRIVLGLIGMSIGGLILGAGVLLAWGDITARSFGGMAIAAIAIMVVLLFVVAVVFGIIHWILDQLVVPAMYALDAPVRTAWSRVRAEVLGPNLGTIVVYWLVRLGVGILVGLVAAMVTLLTCCIAALPYVGAVILLPATMLMRSWSLYFIEQFGDAFRVFPTTGTETLDGATSDV